MTKPWPENEENTKRRQSGVEAEGKRRGSPGKNGVIPKLLTDRNYILIVFPV
jgi:hypothetical protein